MDIPPPPASPPPEAAPEQKEQDKPSYHHAGNGKVSRLPFKLRDQVGIMILDNVPFAKIIESLGEHGKGITEGNVGNWKVAGFIPWRADFERRQALHQSRESAVALNEEKAAGPVQDAGRTVAAAQLYELIQTFDPTAFAAAIAQKPELYLRIITILARLSEGDALCAHRRALEAYTQTKLQTDKKESSDKNILSEAALREIARQIKLLP